MDKLIVVVMGPGKKHFAKMCLDSVKDADKILYWTSEFNFNDKRIEVHHNGWNEQDPTTNGKCRQRYLEHLKKNYPDDWCLVIDEDEIVEDLQKIKDFIQKVEPGIYNVKMRHFIGNIGHEDATRPIHVVPGRLFKISEAIKYPEHSHPVLEGELKGACLDTCIWHCGHLPVEYLDYIKTRYHQHLNDSIIHNQQFLKNWYYSHLLGQYPTRQINPVELPKQLCERYNINKDEFYFTNRNLELKHFIDAIHWKDYFNLFKKRVIEVGCGKGPRVYAMLNIGIQAIGMEISKYACKYSISYPGTIINQDITKDYNDENETAELVVAYDVLEHISYKKLDNVIKKLIKLTNKYILISVPVEGDPNLEADPTHIIKEDKEWWIKQFTDKRLKLIPTPEHFLYKEQVMIFSK